MTKRNDQNNEPDGTSINNTEPATARWSVALFSSRESAEVLIKAIKAALRAGHETSMIVDVVVNGNRLLAEQINTQHQAILDEEHSNAVLRIWCIDLADKANAWNEYIYRIRPNSETAFFVDGYVEVLPDAFSALERGIYRSEHYLAASGVPSMGRSAARLSEQMVRNGGIHGNLFAMKRSTLAALRASGFKLPLAIYRTDPTLGAALAFDLDPSNNEFDNSHILVEPQASWSYTPLSIFKASHLLSHMKRAARQAQGDLENRAVRNHFAVLKSDLASLPATAQELVETWLSKASGNEKLIFLKRPLCLYALYRLRKRPRHPPSRAELLDTN